MATTTGNVVKLFNDKVTAKARRNTHTIVDTIVIGADGVGKWRIPPFQRPLRVNDKVRALAEQIKLDGGVIPGVITLGKIGSDTYLLDGQHRREAFLISGAPEAFMDIRVHSFDTMAEMGEEFVNLNSQLVRMRPDDILRGLEGTVEAVGLIRKRCPFVGYDSIRRSDTSPVLSMTLVIRVWRASMCEVPSTTSGSGAGQLAMEMQISEAERCCDFLSWCMDAWGRDHEYVRLWGSLNLSVTAWLYRRVVLVESDGPKVKKLSHSDLSKCLKAMSADAGYLDWLHGRTLAEANRSPCYQRIKAIWAKRLEQESGKRPMLPQPAWSHGSSTRSYK